MFRVSEEGADRWKVSGGFRQRPEKFKTKEQTARKELENFRRRSRPLEGDWGISTETREIHSKEQAARKELENFRRRSNPLERK